MQVRPTSRTTATPRALVARPHPIAHLQASLQASLQGWLKSPAGLVLPLMLASLVWVSLQEPNRNLWLVDGQIAVVVFAAAALSSIAGFAFSPLAATVLIYLLPAPTAMVGLLVTCSIAIQLYSVASLWRSIDWRRLLPFLAAGLVTLPVGLYALLHAAPGPYRLGLGGFLIAYALYMAFAPRRLPIAGSTLGDAVAGALGGITGGLAAFPGGPVTIWCGLRGGDKTAQRAIYQPFILVMQIATLAMLPLMIDAKASVGVGLGALPYAPAALAGAMIGLEIFRRFTDLQFNRAVLVLLVVSGLGMLVH